MIQISDLTIIAEKDIPQLIKKISPELNKRKKLYERYRRKTMSHELLYESTDAGDTKIPFEKYAVDVSAGYLGGKEPKYEVEEISDEKKQIYKKALDKEVTNNKSEMEILIKYITDYNDDATEHYELVKDYLMLTGAYETIYENENNEIVYSRLNPLQTVAVYDYSTPLNLIGLVRTWEEKNINDDVVTIVEIIDKTGQRTYRGLGDTYTELTDRRKENTWKDVPAFAVENQDGIAIFETVVSIIKKYQQVYSNESNTFKYNDEAKLGITGYAPENPSVIQDDKGNWIENPARVKEDEVILNAKILYFPDKDGKAQWIEKNINDNANMNFKKTTIDLITMLSGVPNMTDLGFTNADNASAIDRKFFVLEQMLINAVAQFKKAYLRRWELIFDRINLKKNTNYDFRDIKIKLYRNLPTDRSTETKTALSLKGTVSDETVIRMLPYEIDPSTEFTRIDEQNSKELQKMQEIVGENVGKLENNRLNTDKIETEDEQNKSDSTGQDTSNI